jgi:hypothetical protein
MKTDFIDVLLRPDNLPVLLLLPTFGILFLWWRWHAMRNDARIDEKGLSAVADAMRGPVPVSTPRLGFDDPERVHTWPYLLRIELLVTLACLSLLTVWSILVDAPLEQLADPQRTPNPSKAPWYFLGLQELLVYFDPWIAGVVLPVLIVLGLCSIPYLDPNPEGSGYYCWRSRRWALTVFWAGLVLWLGLIVIGTFFRGPGWNWFWPWEAWDPHRAFSAPNRNWSDLFGITHPGFAFWLGGLTVVGYYGLAGLGWWWGRRHRVLRELGPGRYAWTAFLLLTMMAIPLKMTLRLAFDVHYVWATPWFNL